MILNQCAHFQTQPIQACTNKYRPLCNAFTIISTSLTSMSVWKLNKSIFCQLLPSRARTFHAWKGVTNRNRKGSGSDRGGEGWKAFPVAWGKLVKVEGQPHIELMKFCINIIYTNTSFCLPSSLKTFNTFINLNGRFFKNENSYVQNFK